VICVRVWAEDRGSTASSDGLDTGCYLFMVSEIQLVNSEWLQSKLANLNCQSWLCLGGYETCVAGKLCDPINHWACLMRLTLFKMAALYMCTIIYIHFVAISLHWNGTYEVQLQSVSLSVRYELFLVVLDWQVTRLWIALQKLSYSCQCLDWLSLILIKNYSCVFRF